MFDTVTCPMCHEDAVAVTDLDGVWLSCFECGNEGYLS